jgi:hypothetical protein
MAEVIIKKREQTEVLKATIGKETYSIPLATNLPYMKLKAMRTDDKVIEFFKEYIPEEVFNELTTNELMQLVKAWNDATVQSQGLTVGES